MPSSHRDGAIRTTHNGPCAVKGIGVAEIKDEPRVLRGTRESHGGSCLNAKGLVGLGTGHVWSRSSGGSPAAAYVDGARGSSGTAGVLRGTNARGVRGGANIILDLLLGVLADDIEVEQ